MEDKLKRHWQEQLADWKHQKEQAGFFSLGKRFKESHLPQLQAFLNHPEQVVCLIKGSAWSGKTQLCRKWFAHHIQNFREEKQAEGQQIIPIPLWIDLKRYTSVTHGKLLDVYLQQLGLTQEEVQALQQQPTVFICEGYDEWGKWQNIYIADYFQKYWLNSKLVVTCHDTYLWGFNSTLYFTPFSGDLPQKKAYKEIVLPNPIPKGEITEVWLNHSFQAHAVKFKNQWQALDIQSESEFINYCWNYTKQLLPYFKQNSQGIHFQPLNNLSSHRSEAVKLHQLLYGTDPLLRLLRAACPLESSNKFFFRWMHADLHKVIAKFSLNKIIELPLSKEYIQLSKKEAKPTAAEYTSETVPFVKSIDKGEKVNSTDIPKCDQNSVYTQFSVDRLRCGDSKSENYRKTLLQVIGLSKTNQSVKTLTAAQAITTLAAEDISFYKMDLSDASLEGADLSYGVYSGASFYKANLRGVNFTGACLSYADFAEADLTDAGFGEFPLIKLKNQITSIDHIKDGQYLAIASRKDIKIYEKGDNENYKLLRTLKGHKYLVKSVKYSPNHQMIASGSSGGGNLRGDEPDWTVRIWDTGNGKEVAKLAGHTGPVTSVAYSFDGQKIISGAEGGDSSVRLWDTSECKEIARFIGFWVPGHTSSVSSVAYSPNEHIIAAGSGGSGGLSENIVRLWDVRTRSDKEIAKLIGHTSSVNSIAYSLDGRMIVSGSSDGSIRLWDLATSKEVVKFLGHNNIVNCVLYDSGNQIVASGSDDSTIRIWDVASGKQLSILEGHTDFVRSIAYSQDGQRILSGGYDSTVRIWDVVNHKKLAKYPGLIHPVTCLDYNSENHAIVSASGDPRYSRKGDSELKIWDSISGKEIIQLKGHMSNINSVAYSPDKQTIISGSGNGAYDKDSVVRVWDVASGKELFKLEGHTRGVISIAYSPDNKRIVSGSEDNILHVWDAVSGKKLIQLKNHQECHRDFMKSVAYSPDNQKLVSASWNGGIVWIWDSVSGKELMQLKGHTSMVNCVAYSSDGQRIVSGSNDKTVRVWDAVSGKELMQFKGHTSMVNCVAYSSDSQRIISGSSDQTVRIWDAVSGKELSQLVGHRSCIKSIVYSSDKEGQKIISGSKDKTILVWRKNIHEESSREIWIIERRISSNRSLIADGASLQKAVIAAANGNLLEQRKAVKENSNFLYHREIRKRSQHQDKRRVYSVDSTFENFGKFKTKAIAKYTFRFFDAKTLKSAGCVSKNFHDLQHNIEQERTKECKL